MTLKEELSISRRNAIAEQKKIDAQAVKEMREMIPEYIEPILRAMHNSYPFEKELSVVVENCGVLKFKPLFLIDENKYRRHYQCKLLASQLLPAALRVGKEFDLDVKQSEANNHIYVFTMTLDD